MGLIRDYWQKAGMAMRHRAALGKDIFLRVSGFWLVPCLVLSALALWRDEGPQNLQPPLLSDVAGWLPLSAWAVIVLLILLVLTFEGAYRLVKKNGEEAIIEALSETTKHRIVAWESQLVKGMAVSNIHDDMMSELREHDLVDIYVAAGPTGGITIGNLPPRSSGQHPFAMLNQRGNRILKKLKRLQDINSE